MATFVGSSPWVDRTVFGGAVTEMSEPNDCGVEPPGVTASGPDGVGVAGVTTSVPNQDGLSESLRSEPLGRGGAAPTTSGPEGVIYSKSGAEL